MARRVLPSRLELKRRDGSTNAAPLAGGPFVTIAGGKDTISREPRVRIPGTEALETNARLERRHDVKEAHGPAHGPGPIEPKY